MYKELLRCLCTMLVSCDEFCCDAPFSMPNVTEYTNFICYFKMVLLFSYSLCFYYLVFIKVVLCYCLQMFYLNA